MWVVLAIVTLVILVILVVVSLLCIPLQLVYYLHTDKTPKIRCRVVWFFGLVDKYLEKPVPIPGWEKVASLITGRHIYDTFTTSCKIFKIEGFFMRVKQLVEGIFCSMKVNDLKADLKIEIANPLYAGIAFAIAAPINMVLKRLPYEISIWPSFTTRYFLDGQAQIDFRTRPILFIPPLARFTFSKPAIKAFRILAAAKWKQKK
jgi:hypothetical protein